MKIKLQEEANSNSEFGIQNSAKKFLILHSELSLPPFSKMHTKLRITLLTFERNGKGEMKDENIFLPVVCIF